MRWFDNLRKRASEQRYAAGYNWAAGELLRGKPVDELNMQLDNPFYPNEFDVGGRDAVTAFLHATHKS